MTVFQKRLMQWKRHTNILNLMIRWKKVDHVDIRVKNYLELTGYEKLAKVHANVYWGSVMISNIVEWINACFVDAGKLSVYDFLEKVT